MILYSDRGVPDGFRHMHGYGSHTFKMVNDKNEFVWVKFHIRVSSCSPSLNAAHLLFLARRIKGSKTSTQPSRRFSLENSRTTPSPIFTMLSQRKIIRVGPFMFKYDDDALQKNRLETSV
jgi:hypothetical protein